MKKFTQTIKDVIIIGLLFFGVFTATFFLTLFLIVLVMEDPSTIPDTAALAAFLLPFSLSVGICIKVQEKRREKRKIAVLIQKANAEPVLEPVLPHRHIVQETVPAPREVPTPETVDPAMGFCSSCGSRIFRSAAYCPECGASTNFKTAPVRQAAPSVNHRPQVDTSHTSIRTCSRCQSTQIQYQTVTESRPTGCMTVLWYIFLCLTIFGLLIVIPLMLRKKTNTITYAVCQNCGRRWKV